VDGRILALIGVLVVVLAVLLTSFGVKATHAGEALPGTRVAGVDVGGTDRVTISRRLKPVLTAQRTVLLRADGELIRVKASDLGYAIDLDGTVDAAVRAGRGGIIGPLRGLVSTRDVPVRASFDEARTAKALDEVKAEVGRDAFAGALKVDPETLEVTTTKPRPGRTIDEDRLGTLVRRELLAGRRGPIDVPLKTVPAVSESRLEGLSADAEQYLQEPLTLRGAGKPLELRAEETAKLLVLESQDDGTKARLGAGGDGLTALLDRVVARGRVAGRDARITAPATAGSLTAKGDASWSPKRVSVTVRAARKGREVERTRLASRIRAAVRAGRHRVRVPRKTVDAAVSTADARKVKYLVGTFTTPYVAGQPRVTNIRQMARTVDGTLIPAGGTFSLNGITGERTKAKGYVEAPFIANNKIEPSIGGGVSQFSTTTYNAAYFAGLQLDAFRAHSLYIDRYPPGRESTLNFPDIDLKWTNDTDAPILVRTSYDDAGVTVSLYGDNGGRRVTAKAGDREAADGGDFQITVTRTVRYADGHRAVQPQTTRYENEAEGSTE
jgi:vancomycin resistance protein YoaR